MSRARGDGDDPFLPCVLCEKRLRANEPFLVSTFLPAGQDRDLPGIGTAPFHLRCLIESIGAHVADLVEHGDDDQAEEDELDDLVQTVGRLVRRELRGR